MGAPVIQGFRLEAGERVFRGGMGEVWYARHLRTGLSAAVKLVLREREGDQAHHAVFEDEVHLAARLDHPNVLQVYDAGRLGEEAAHATQGRLRAGEPYVIMEWASGGALRVPPLVGLPWPKAKVVLTATLEALAHAHARGVLHRDIKPSNLLRCSMDDVRPGWKLADFGLALAMGRPRGEHAVNGLTPAYAAPETWAGAWDEIGPPTDLYALGCMAWHLVMGAQPFADTFDRPIAVRHREEAFPRLLSDAGTPGGLESWIFRLTRKRPEDRYSCAAEALAALRDLDAGQPPAARPPVGPPDGTTAAWEPERAAPEARPVSIAMEAPDTGAPSLPAVLATGLQLVALRTPPVAGRVAIRSTLWGLLHAAARDGANAIALRGPSGAGRSRMITWLAEMAEEHLGSPVLKLDCKMPDVLRTAVARWFRVEGASLLVATRTVAARLQAVPGGDPNGAAALARWLTGSDIDGSALPYAMRAFLSAFAPSQARAPAVITLDDLQDSADLMALLRAALVDGHPGPLSLALTIDEHPEPALARLLDAPRCQILDVPLMSAGELTDLIRQLVPLEPRLLDRLVQRAQGLPFVAVQSVLDLIAAEALVEGPQGYGARGDLPLPGGSGEIWARRLQAAQRASTDAVQHLSVLAIFGEPATIATWMAVVQAAGLAWASASPSRLDSLGLVRMVGDRWAPVHTSLWPALPPLDPEVARRAHAAAAAELQRIARSPEQLAAVGRHLRRAGRQGDARESLRTAVGSLLQASRYLGAAEALDEWAGCLDEAGTSADDPERREIWRARLRVALGRGAYSAVWAETGQYLSVHRESQGLRERAEVLRMRGLAEQRRPSGDRLAAEAYLHQACQLARDAGDSGGEGRGHLHIGALLRDGGARAESLAAFESARQCFSQAQDEHGVADALIARAETAIQLSGPTVEAADDAREALARFRAMDNPFGVGRAYNALGDILRGAEELDQAEAAYQSSLQILSAVGSEEAAIVRANLGLVLLARGRWGAARQTLTLALAEAERPGRAFLRPFLRAALLVCAARAEDPEAIRSHADAYARLQSDSANRLTSTELERLLQEAFKLVIHSVIPAVRETAVQLQGLQVQEGCG